MQLSKVSNQKASSGYFLTSSRLQCGAATAAAVHSSGFTSARATQSARAAAGRPAPWDARPRAWLLSLEEFREHTSAQSTYSTSIHRGPRGDKRGGTQMRDQPTLMSFATLGYYSFSHFIKSSLHCKNYHGRLHVMLCVAAPESSEGGAKCSFR